MGEVITDKDKEYEKMEREAAPGPDQAMSDRVNNRSLRPRSEAFKEFMTTGWDDNEPQIEPLESSKYTPARLEAFRPDSRRCATTIAITRSVRIRRFPTTPVWVRISRPARCWC